MWIFAIKVWSLAFYRRHGLVFLIGILLVAGMFRPPTLLIGPEFMAGLWDSPYLTWGVAGACAGYLGYAFRWMWHRLHHPENRWLQELAILPIWRQWMMGLGVSALPALPAAGYWSVLAVYGVNGGRWEGSLFLGLILLGWLVSGWALAWAIRHPRPGIWRSRSSRPRWVGFVGMYVRMMWAEHRGVTLWVKGAVLVLLGLAMWGEVVDPMPGKGLRLVWWTLSFGQAILAFLLRGTEDRQLFLLRNLPISRARRWLAYAAFGGLMLVPEYFVGICVAGWGGVPIWGLWEYLQLGVAVFLLTSSALYYLPAEMTPFLKSLLWAFMLGFFLLLFGLPVWVMSGTMVILAIGIFSEEYPRWNGPIGES
ncbi:hypothetical protein [Pontibacter sp. G13]|uniref:hypothetical protein n=1 Tax=Pontibacter sp. G13 TaxID=3074898 RepID=UPI00288B7631|nr:hypothetical protein [Pontibacter sp. G13]WNJ21598.1 hypothetical protein RJD25_29100 [Pontibacter sp. G13]